MDRFIRTASASRRHVRSVAIVIAGAFLLIVSLASAAFAAESPDSTGGSRVVLSGQIDVAAGETAQDVVVLHGAATVDGTVDGAVVVFDGPVTINGEVTRDVVAFNGAVVIGDGASISGDVVSPRTPQVAEGASIGGAVHRVRADWGLGSVTGSWFWSWLAVSASTLALGLLLVLFAPRAADAALTTAQTQPGRALVGGLVVAIGLPVIAVLAILTVVGIPFGVGLLLAFALLYAVGYVTVAWLVGRVIRPRQASQLVVFMVGWMIVRALALVPFLEGLLWFPGAALGLGVLGVAAWNARRPSGAPLSRSHPPAGAHV